MFNVVNRGGVPMILDGETGAEHAINSRAGHTYLTGAGRYGAFVDFQVMKTS
jgi:hypothetical protein